MVLHYFENSEGRVIKANGTCKLNEIYCLNVDSIQTSYGSVNSVAMYVLDRRLIE